MTDVKWLVTLVIVTKVIIYLTMANSFVEWLQDEMSQRELSGSDLARLSGMSQSMVSMVLGEQRQPGTDFCEGIARAFRIPVDIVFNKAGLLPASKELDERSKEIIHLYQMMNEENRDDLTAYARMKLAQQKKKEGKNKRPPTRPGAG